MTWGNKIGCSGESIRNEDAMYIMRLVVNSLDCEKTVIINNLVNVIEDVVSCETNGVDTIGIQDKISQTDKKQKRLLDLYMAGDIAKAEFIKARDKCEIEIQEFKNLIESVENQNLLVQEQQNVMNDIKNALMEMILGASHDDEFYRNILNKMVIHDRDHVDVYLNLLSHKWSYAIEKANKIKEYEGSDKLRNNYLYDIGTSGTKMSQSPKQWTSLVITSC